MALARLSDALPTTDPKKFGVLFFPMWQAQGILREFIKSPYFVHSKSVAQELLVGLRELDTEGRKAKDKDDKDKEEFPYDFEKEIQYWHVSNLKEKIGELETVMARESPTVPIFFIPQKGIYKTDELINRAETMFSAELQKGIPRQAITDVHEAGRCIAFELSTAAGFHVLRATEALTREYYKFVTNRDSGGLPPDARQIISRVGRGFGPPGAVAVALF